MIIFILLCFITLIFILKRIYVLEKQVDFLIDTQITDDFWKEDDSF